VPFARFAAQHQEELTFPFKRYHIAKVWRGENTQRGRYREFTQCDFDIIGSDAPAADFEILLMIRAALQTLGTSVRIHLNHRGLFNRFLDHIGASGKSVEVLRTVDKLAKAGIDETRQSLAALAGEDGAEKILAFTGSGGSGGGSSSGGFEQTLQRITDLSGGPSPESERLKEIWRFIMDYGANCGADDLFVLDPSITRGLDYYTGIVFETFLTELPEIGSICSGGRYDNLAALYSKNRISGVGSSIGLDRLLAALESLGRLPNAASYAKVAIACVNEAQGGAYQALASRFRDANVPCEVFPEADGKLVKQFALAEKKGIAYLVIPGENPHEDPLTLRDLQKRESREGLSFEAVLEKLGGGPEAHHE
jgi:histidyl-tRNA synthetase